MSRSIRILGLILVVVVASGILAGCGRASEKLSVVHVPEDASLAEAGSRVANGGIILIAPGVYHQSLAVNSDDVTVRGLDRNTVVLDGELTRSNGVVATGKRIAIENLTVQNFVQNGVLVTGVTDENGAGVARGPDGYLPESAPPPVAGYLVQYVTAMNNGLYGIYAFNRTGGIIRENLASGGSDSGIYVGQCESCNALIEKNVLVSNAAGLEFANASDVVVTGNRIVGNRVGITVLSNHLEAHGPSVRVTIAGNVVSDNNAVETPQQAAGGFGVGVGLSGTRNVAVLNNRIERNNVAGVWVTSSEEFAPTENRASGNGWGGNALDLAFTPASGAVGTGNCFSLPPDARTVPSQLGSRECGSSLEPGELTPPPAPAGIAFSKVAHPNRRAGLSDLDETPRNVPNMISLPDVSAVELPSGDLLATDGGR